MANPEFQLFSSLRFDRQLLQNGFSTPFYMLEYHRDRMLQAAEHFQWPEAASAIYGPEGLRHLQDTLEAAIDASSVSTALRVKVLLSEHGKMSVETNETPAVSIESLFPRELPAPEGQEIVVNVSALTGGALQLGQGERLPGAPSRTTAWEVLPDTTATTPTSYTTYKTTSRDMYTSARERAGILTMTEPREVILNSNKGEIMEGTLTSIYFWRNSRWVTVPISSGGQAGTTRRWALEKGWCSEEIVTRDSLQNGEECWISNGVRGFTWGRIRL